MIFAAEDGDTLHRAASASRDPAYAWAADHMLALPPAPDPEHPAWQVFAERTRSSGSSRRSATRRSRRTPSTCARSAPPGRAGRMIVPLVGIRQCVGVLGIASVERGFDARDLRLAQEVARRCALFIENARLHGAERRATQARDEVLGVVAHDPPEPAQQHHAVRGAAPEPGGRAPSTKAIGAIERNAARMNRIIEDLLDVAQLELGQLKVTPARHRRRRPSSPTGRSCGARRPTRRSIALRLDAAEGSPRCGPTGIASPRCSRT